MGGRRRLGRIARDENPTERPVLGVHHARQIEQQGKDSGVACAGGRPSWICQTGFFRQLRRILFAGLAEEGQIFVGRFRDRIEEQPLGAPRLLVHEQRQALVRRVAQPFLDRQAVAPRLGDLLALVVEEQLIGESGRRRAADGPADPAAQAHRIDQVLAGHLVVDVERRPAQRPVDPPLHLAAAVQHGVFERIADPFAGIVDALEHRRPVARPGFGDDGVVDHLPALGADASLVGVNHRNTANSSCAAPRPAGQHDVAHRLVFFQHAQDGLVEPAGAIGIRRAEEFVVEAEPVEEFAQRPLFAAAKLSLFPNGSGVESGASRGGRSARRRPSPRHRAQPVPVRHVVRPCAGRPCRRRSDQPVASRSAPRRRGAPWWSAPPRRTCRYAAGRTGRSRSRTGHGPCPAAGRSAAWRARGLPGTARPSRPRQSRVRSAWAVPMPHRTTRQRASRSGRGFRTSDRTGICGTLPSAVPLPSYRLERRSRGVEISFPCGARPIAQWRKDLGIFCDYVACVRPLSR